jgi:hypothetical protein
MIHDRDNGDFVTMAMNLRGPYNAENFLTEMSDYELLEKDPPPWRESFIKKLYCDDTDWSDMVQYVFNDELWY